MANVCLPKELVEKVLTAIKDGSLNPEKMIEMTSQERREFFTKLVGEHYGREVNALVESKLLLKDYKRGMVTVIKKIAGMSEAAKNDLVSRVDKMEKMLNPAESAAFLEDLVAKKLGTDISLDEAKKITELTNLAREARDKPTEALSGHSDEYLKAANELRDYIQSLKPVSPLASIGKNAAIIARNNLLLNPSTPIKTTLAQLINSGIDLVTRRIGQLSLESKNYDLVRQANKEAWQTFKTTGDNIAAMESLDDVGRLGEGKRFEVPSGMESTNPVVRFVEAATRNVAKYSNKVAIDWEHNIIFTKIYQKAFYDMLNITTSSIARSEGLAGDAAKVRAAELFKDAARIKPKTDIGAMVRQQGHYQAARVTSTNDTYVARLALGVKDALNKTVTGLGDALMPIAKIPANIIWNGIENAGVGIPLGVKDIFVGRMKIQSADLVTRYEGMAQFSNGIQKVARTVGVLGAAAYFASQLKPKDFRTDGYGNYFVQIGNVWINMEYIAAISPALAGMMEVKAKGKANQSILQTAGQYSAGSLSGLKNIPGASDVFGSSGIIAALTNSNYASGIKKYASDFFTSRGEPSFIQNLGKDRAGERILFGAHGIETDAEVKADAKASAKKSAATRAASKK